jgi:hypothetical protein
VSVQKHFQTRGVVQTFSKEKRCQKNAVRKMRAAPVRSKRGGGVYYLSDLDISDILFERNRKQFLREPLARIFHDPHEMPAGRSADLQSALRAR